jgi:protease I
MHAAMKAVTRCSRQADVIVRDGQLITSRKPGDIPAFADAIIGALGAAA